MARVISDSCYLHGVAQLYLVSAEYHERKACIADAEGDREAAAADRHRAAEYRKRARELERAGGSELGRTIQF